MPSLFDPYLTKTRQKDKSFLEKTHLPIITVSATFHQDLKRLHGYPNNETTQDTVFSRAHYSMALAVAIHAWGAGSNSTKTSAHSPNSNPKIDPTKAWLVDPTNHVSRRQLLSISLTEQIGKTIARHPFLKLIKDLIDRFGRHKMPILKSITPPLLYLTQDVRNPILSFHIAAGNILIAQGKAVVQVVTDPHIREEYILYADQKNATYCVFDEATKLEFLEKAALHHIEVDPNRVVVTGPPIDPRVVAARTKKQPWRNGPLKLCLTTGGLGTNKQEITQLLDQLLPAMRKKPLPYQLLAYAGTHQDIHQEILNIAKKHHISISELRDKNARLRVIYHPQIVDANEQLIQFGFPWADGFISKPSGDMAYDAVASGSFLLTLAEWGEWEERIREIFEQKGIARRALTDSIIAQLEVLQAADSKGKAQSWVEKAMLQAQQIDRSYIRGTTEILKQLK
jgi:hypothetical protein